MGETSTTTAPTRRAAVVCAAVALALAVLELLVATFFVVATAADTSEDPLADIGYVFAVALGLPGVLGLLFGGLGWSLARRPVGLGLAIVGVVVAGAPGLWMISLWLPAF
ncbi:MULTISPECIES: hypothetical protein [Nocardioides]|uniref:Major facilitator superfamily (MFS) profile domain-containing protein n=1 Tax=Nocardioides vastitatis TaxID=2568655 RepID=A0ABW0ZC13_9ACTN|nr:hypothetical protein [Nocardioides sp.]THI95950.1 hypothetical protein E7Z54_17915 [Nocardioides sp.]